MMSLDQIREGSRQAAIDAANDGMKPLIITHEDIEDGGEAVRGIPTLGDHLPKGWKRTTIDEAHGVYSGDNEGFGAYMVDNSGFGQPGEAALTINELLEVIEPDFGYAIVEAGQFQIKIGKFELAGPV
jgi:hypothetical protein